jgi:hypothetical protein
LTRRALRDRRSPAGLYNVIDARLFKPLPALVFFSEHLQIRDRTLQLHFFQIRDRAPRPFLAYAPPLYVYLMSLHFRFHPLFCWVASGPVVQICAKPPSTNSSVPVM